MISRWLKGKFTPRITRTNKIAKERRKAPKNLNNRLKCIQDGLSFQIYAIFHQLTSKVDLVTGKMCKFPAKNPVDRVKNGSEIVAGKDKRVNEDETTNAFICKANEVAIYQYSFIFIVFNLF
jgi:hypothetical protein